MRCVSVCDSDALAPHHGLPTRHWTGYSHGCVLHNPEPRAAAPEQGRPAVQVQQQQREQQDGAAAPAAPAVPAAAAEEQELVAVRSREPQAPRPEERRLCELDRLAILARPQHQQQQQQR